MHEECCDFQIKQYAGEDVWFVNLDRHVTGRFSCVLFIVNTDIKANEIKQTTSSYPNR